jgi:hypothetical protein
MNICASMSKPKTFKYNFKNDKWCRINKADLEMKTRFVQMKTRFVQIFANSVLENKDA